MTGSVTQKNGKYYPVIYLGQDELTRKKKYKCGHGFVAKKDADKELRKLLTQFDNDEIVFGVSETFKSVYEQWKEMIAPKLYKAK